MLAPPDFLGSSARVAFEDGPARQEACRRVEPPGLANSSMLGTKEQARGQEDQGGGEFCSPLRHNSTLRCPPSPQAEPTPRQRRANFTIQPYRPTRALPPVQTLGVRVAVAWPATEVRFAFANAAEGGRSGATWSGLKERRGGRGGADGEKPVAQRSLDQTRRATLWLFPPKSLGLSPQRQGDLIGCGLPSPARAQTRSPAQILGHLSARSESRDGQPTV
ncbi:unnamed protein product [Diplocarpon coronariae]|nr:hypothetical protein JHW43_004345 [Diplocarpon mali]